jgi:L-ribulose-5-phosphate 3-epimerase
MDMKHVTRRGFIGKSLAIGVGSVIAPSILRTETAQAAQKSVWVGKNDISLAQWALVDEIRSGKWTNLDFPRIAREDFGINGVEVREYPFRGAHV